MPLGFDLCLFLFIFWLRVFLSIERSLFFKVNTSAFVLDKKSCLFFIYFDSSFIFWGLGSLIDCSVLYSSTFTSWTGFLGIFSSIFGLVAGLVLCLVFGLTKELFLVEGSISDMSCDT